MSKDNSTPKLSFNDLIKMSNDDIAKKNQNVRDAIDKVHSQIREFELIQNVLRLFEDSIIHVEENKVTTQHTLCLVPIVWLGKEKYNHYTEMLEKEKTISDEEYLEHIKNDMLDVLNRILPKVNSYLEFNLCVKSITIERFSPYYSWNNIFEYKAIIDIDQ